MAIPKTSKEAREILEQLRRTGIRPNLWARAALGYSLSLASEPEAREYDSEGSEFQDGVFFGEDEGPLMALLRQRLGRVPEPAETGGLIKAHVERGLRHFNDEYLRLNKRSDELMVHLLNQCSLATETNPRKTTELLPALPASGSYKVMLQVGADAKSGAAVEHDLNGPGCTPHVAIMGRNSTGKTRTGLQLLREIRAKAPYNIPYLVFDYAKGDIAAKDDFVADTEATLIRMPGDMIPLAPLSIPEDATHAIQIAARRFRDTVCSVVRGLGAKQKDRCLRLMTSVYRDFGSRTPDLVDVLQFAEEDYAENNWSADSLLACLREFADFPLFRSATEGTSHDLFRRSHIVDLHTLPEDLRKLAVFLLLDRLYAEIMCLPDAPLDKAGYRQIRLIIVIDEAHHYLPCKQQTLENMIREVRSKGVALWLFSQSPDDFDQARFNFAREMGLSIVFSCVVEKPRMLEALLGGKVNPTQLSFLPPGVALTRLTDTSAPVEVRTWEP